MSLKLQKANALTVLAEIRDPSSHGTVGMSSDSRATCSLALSSGTAATTGLAQLSARPTTNRYSPDMAFCLLVVPLLLLSGPCLRGSAIYAGEMVVLIPARKIPVGVDMRQFAAIGKNGSGRRFIAWHMWRQKRQFVFHTHLLTCHADRFIPISIWGLMCRDPRMHQRLQEPAPRANRAWMDTRFARRPGSYSFPEALRLMMYFSARLITSRIQGATNECPAAAGSEFNGLVMHS